MLHVAVHCIVPNFINYGDVSFWGGFQLSFYFFCLIYFYMIVCQLHQNISVLLVPRFFTVILTIFLSVCHCYGILV